MANTSVFELASLDDTVVIARIRDGLPASTFAEAAEAVGLPLAAVADKLGLAKRTLDRKRQTGEALSRDESERVLRFARVCNLAGKVFENRAAVGAWLQRPSPALQQAPIDLLDTDLGARAVEGILRGIAHGNIL